MGPIKKAMVAGLGAALGAAILGLKTEIPQTDDGWVALIVGSLTVGVVTGLATWKARNTGLPVGGSEPRR